MERMMEQERKQVMPWKVKELKRDQNGKKKKEERERNWRESWQRGEIGSWKTEVKEDKTKMNDERTREQQGSGAIERGCACMRY